MRFAEPTYLYLLIIAVICVAVHYYTNIRRRHRLKIFGSKDIIGQLTVGVANRKRELKFWLIIIALIFIILMLARPQRGMRLQTDKRSGIEIMVALDVSNSMLAEDLTPSRLDRCKLLLEKLIEHFDEDKLGLIVFAGDAFVQLPITADYVSAKMFINDISTNMVATQGTDIAKAIELSSASFSKQQDIGRAIIIITDGEDHEGGAEEAAAKAKKKGQNVFVLGSGSTKGAPIPLDGEYLKDENGTTVMSRLNENMCQQIAKKGGGKYISIDNSALAEEYLDDALSKLAHNEYQTSTYNQYDEQFQAFALLAFLLLIIEIFISEKNSKIVKKMHIFRNRNLKIFLLLLLFFAIKLTASAQDDRNYVRRGNRAYNKKEYAKAEVSYRKALEKNKENPQAIYNLGNTLLMQGKDSLAMVQYVTALDFEKDKKRRSMIFHNMGVVCQASKQFAQAIEAYKASLRLNPSDDQTRYNLVLCQKQLKDNKDNKDNQNKKDNKKDNKKNDQNKDKQDKKQNQQQNQEQTPQQQPSPQHNDEMDKQTAEQLLNAALQQEKATQEKMRQQKGSTRSLKHNW